MGFRFGDKEQGIMEYGLRLWIIDYGFRIRDLGLEIRDKGIGIMN